MLDLFARLPYKDEIIDNAKNVDVITPLQLAVKSQNYPIVRKLIDIGANPQLTTSNSFTSLHIAAELKDVRILGALIEAAKPETVHAKTSDGITPVMSASAAGHLDNVNLLMEKGADLWELNPLNLNSFDLMAMRGQTDLLKWVIEKWK